jgi:hypothetical protein
MCASSERENNNEKTVRLRYLGTMMTKLSGLERNPNDCAEPQARVMRFLTWRIKCGSRINSHQ